MLFFNCVVIKQSGNPWLRFTERPHPHCLALGFALLIAVPAVAEKARGDRIPDVAEVTGSMTLAERHLLNVLALQQQIFDRYDHKDREPEAYEKAEFELLLRQLMSAYEELIAEDPENVLLYIHYGKMLRKIGQDEYALRIFLKADHLEGKFAVIKQQIGNYLAENGRFSEALVCFLQAIEIEPEEALYHYQLGELLVLFRENFIAEEILFPDVVDEKILTAFSYAVELEPENRGYRMRRAESFYDIENPDWENALILWDALQEDASSEFEREAIQLHRARAMVELKRYSKAKEALEEVRDTRLAYSRQWVLQKLPDSPSKSGENLVRQEPPLAKQP